MCVMSEPARQSIPNYMCDAEIKSLSCRRSSLSRPRRFLVIGPSGTFFYQPLAHSELGLKFLNFAIMGHRRSTQRDGCEFQLMPRSTNRPLVHCPAKAGFAKGPHGANATTPAELPAPALETVLALIYAILRCHGLTDDLGRKRHRCASFRNN